MENELAWFKKNKTKLLSFALTGAIIVLIGLTVKEVLTPIDPATQKQLENEILGKSILYDTSIISRVERRRDYGREIQTEYVQIKREKLKNTGLPENFFDATRLFKCYSSPRPEEC